tara:strand:- start:2032 stop:3315 length:1284 start_codon:yes stop_codon:yes gene_type:complete
MRKVILLSLNMFLFIGIGLGQKEKTDFKEYMPSIGIHGGALSYLGDVKGAAGSNILTYWKPSYGFYLEKKISPVFGISVNGLFGKISKSQLDDNVFLNFETSITNFDVNVLFDFDNGKIINESSPFAPFISVGVGYLSFDPKGDLFNDETLYNHWDDGTLRDLPQGSPGSDSLSNVITRDYTYESSLKDSANSYSKTAITIPIRLGFKFEISEHIDVRMSAAYILSMTDYLDNIPNGGNDKMIYTSFGLQYNFESKTSKNDKYKDFSFSDLDVEDADNDGVVDHKDLCQGTPKGVTVDVKGCAVDGDEDGVPDYKDKDLKTVPGVVVNRYGIQLTDEMVEEFVMDDSVETKYSIYFDGDQLTTDQINSYVRKSTPKIIVPKEFEKQDLNNDGSISAEEMTAVVNGMRKENALTVTKLNKLLKFYFEQ